MIASPAEDFADYCIMNDFDLAWSFAFGGLTGPGEGWMATEGCPLGRDSLSMLVAHGL